MPITLTVGAGVSAPGQQVFIPIRLQTADVPVRAIQVHLAFNPIPFSSVVGRAGGFIPASWIVSSNLAAPGDLRFIVADPTGVGKSFDEGILFAGFTIAHNATPQSIPVNISFQDIRDQTNTQLAVTTTNGSITINPTILASNIATLTVTHPEAVRLDISPEVTSIPIGATQQYTAVCTLADSTTLTCTDHVRWISLTPAIATIDAAGLATGISAGEGRIMAQLLSPAVQ